MAAILSIVALVLAIAIGYWRKINIGMLSIAFAAIVGLGFAEMEPKEIIGGWPLSLFFMLLAMTLLFAIARVNGTLELVARKVVAFTGGRRRFIPPVFFLMAGFIAAIGAGNISTCALLLPIAMAVSTEERISPLLMATMVIAGANAGGLSPIAPTGIIGVTLVRETGLPYIGMAVFFKQIIGQSIFALLLYFLLKGHRLTNVAAGIEAPRQAFKKVHGLTMAVFAAVIGAIIFAGVNIGLAAFVGAVVLLLCKAADEEASLRKVPWSTIILVCGVGMLVQVADQSGGIEVMADGLKAIMNEHTAGPIIAVVGGILSIVSSASGVVMPTLIPTVPRIVEDTGGNPTQIVAAIIMGAHVVTNSPISTLGALAVAAAGPEIDKDRLFRNMLLVGVLGLGYAALIAFTGLV
jgi:Na+/H+ antiporter NhaD/arsenite permease-like protein